MRRTPFQQFGDMLGMYAYLTAMGGLRYWPAVQRAGIDEVSLPIEPERPGGAGQTQLEAMSGEYISQRERIPV